LSTDRSLRLLMIDDSEQDVELVVIELRRHGYAVAVERVDTDAGLQTELESSAWDIVVCDHGLPSFSSQEALAMVQESDADLPFVILSGTIGEEAAVESLKAGARDVVLKTNLARIGPVVDRELFEAKNRRGRREVERALAESEARKSAILQSALDGVVTIDHDGRILNFNPAAEAMFGYVLADVAGKHMAELIIPPSLRPRHEAAFARQLATGESTVLGVRTELSAQRADGTEFPVEISITRGELSGEAFFTAYLRDLTERKEAEKAHANLEEQLRQSQKMEAIGSLAGGIAHDFNNILLAIRGFSSLLLKTLTDEREREQVRQVDLAAERAAELTRQLLAYSRQQVLQPAPTDVNSVVEETLGLLRRLIGENIELSCKLAPHLETILVDRGQLGQVILNLAVNARDAMPNGGALTIQTSNVSLDDTYVASHEEMVPGQYTLLQITDTGIGMDDETRIRIFDPYYTTKAEGTGLGLATVHGIVRQSGGHIWLYSEPGLGTTFRLYFPTTQEAVVPVPEPADVIVLEGDETILVVEDASILRPLLLQLLESYGYRVLLAASGAEALEIAAREPAIDLLMTDLVMPGMNGRELAEQLQAERPTIRVLFTSGYPADTSLLRGIAERRVAFIQKPYVADELARTVRETLEPH
jgi:two-component system cell cycle sensor histidine kinase/response regulator CckA